MLSYDHAEEALKLLHDDLFWNKMWSVAFQPKNGERSQNVVETWNQKAEAFSKNVLGEKGRPRVEKIIRWLEQQGMRMEGKTILDLGAGPGAFTLPFAAKAKEVVALEPAAAMTRILRDNLDEVTRNRVRIVERVWEDISLEEEGWERKFDLVFISMNPGIDNWEMLEKAIRCSKKYVYISTFAGRRDIRAINELWPLLFREEMPPMALDIMYMMNLLYAKGYDLEISIWEERRKQHIPKKQAEADILNYLKLFKPQDVDERVKREVRKYVDEKAAGGEFLHQANTRLGKILIKLKDESP